MSRVTRRPEADDDLLEIAVYIGQDDLEASDRFIDQLTERFELLATQPEMGRPTPDGIDVVRVLSGARDIDALF